jgi:hypothetical protein
MTTACCLLLLTGAVLLICLLLFALLLLPLLLVAAIADWADDDDDDSCPFILPDASTCCHSSLPLARRSSSCQSSRSKHSVTSCANISWVLTKSCERSVHVDLMRLNTASLVLPAPFVMEVSLPPPPPPTLWYNLSRAFEMCECCVLLGAISLSRFLQVLTCTCGFWAGMGVFDLTTAQLKCLTAMDWLNDEVVNAYMSLLGLRNKTRWNKYAAAQHKHQDANNEDEVMSKEQVHAKTDEGHGKEEHTVDGVDDVKVMSAKECDDKGEEDAQQPAQMERRSTRSGGAGGGDACNAKARDNGGREGVKERRRERRKTGGGDKDDDKTREKDHDKSAPIRTAFFSSFFYALLRNAKGGYKYENVRRWSRDKVSFLSCINSRTLILKCLGVLVFMCVYLCVCTFVLCGRICSCVGFSVCH